MMMGPRIVLAFRASEGHDEYIRLAMTDEGATPLAPALLSSKLAALIYVTLDKLKERGVKLVSVD